MSLFKVSIIFCWLLVTVNFSKTTFNFSKTLVVMLICVAFVGQAIASTTMSYHMASYHMTSMTEMNGQVQSQDMQIIDHNSQNIVSNFSDHVQTSTEDCCAKTDSSCFTGSCSHVATLMEDNINELIVDLSPKILSYSCLVKSQQPTSLYRPPILS